MPVFSVNLKERQLIIFSFFVWIPILVGNKNQSLPNFVRKHIMFGIQLDDKNNVFFINIMLILGKFLINANV